jgi:hypothetical protein
VAVGSKEFHPAKKGFMDFWSSKWPSKRAKRRAFAYFGAESRSNANASRVVRACNYLKAFAWW